MDEKNDVSRRSFLKCTGAAVAGFTVAGSMGVLLGKTVNAPRNAEAAAQTAAYQPLPYVKLDPDKAAELSYVGYSKGG
jgi:hypothetical protein